MHSRHLQYRLVDVFTDRIFGGNPLAVFLDGRGVSDREMQLLAREMNLSETTFVLPPDDSANHFRVRIFTPGRELPMAGHPTIGTTFVLAREGMLPPSGDAVVVRLEENVGVIPVRVLNNQGEPGMIWMTQPRPQFVRRLDDPRAVAEMLSVNRDDIRDDLPIEIVSCGVPFLIVPLRTLYAMRQIRFQRERACKLLDSLGTNEVLTFCEEVEHEGSTVHSRMFAPELGVPEDPATGSATGPLAAYLVRYGVTARGADIVSEQGIELGRPSFLHAGTLHHGDNITGVEVGGTAIFVGSGEISLPA